MGAYDPTAWGVEFLSTLSLRRATAYNLDSVLEICDFYPRSPCGERPPGTGRRAAYGYFYPRSPCGERPRWPPT